MYIGIDAGGTKTDICICDSAGRIIARDISCGVNAAKAGVDAAAAHFAGRLKHIGFVRADSLYAGVAGAGTVADALKTALMERLPGITRTAVASDAFNALNGEVGPGDGIALISGTGSAAFVRIGGKTRQVGGRGYLIDDGGSGYWTGRECLNAVYRALDGRGPATSLAQAVADMPGGTPESMIKRIYDGGSAFVASFAPMVFTHAENGDTVAADIAERCARELVLHLKACAAPEIRVCVASGGMFRAGYLRSRLREAADGLDMDIIFPDVPPVCGAVVTAAGADGDSDFTATLKNGLKG